MSKPRGPLPPLTEDQQDRFLFTRRENIEAITRNRRALLHELTAAGWSLRQLAELYCCSHATIRHWMRAPVPPDATAAEGTGYPRGDGGG